VKPLPDKELLGGVFDLALLPFYRLLAQFGHDAQKRTFVFYVDLESCQAK
jgi:hypothetical protein